MHREIPYTLRSPSGCFLRWERVALHLLVKPPDISGGLTYEPLTTGEWSYLLFSLISRQKNGRM
nr:MAG TPA: hypothetical protein [Bacteriophage sp.]